MGNLIDYKEVYNRKTKLYRNSSKHEARRNKKLQKQCEKLFEWIYNERRG